MSAPVFSTSSTSSRAKRRRESDVTDHDDEDQPKISSEPTRGIVDIDKNTNISATTNMEMAQSKEYLKYKPEGYDINPPPTSRPVRIYADGVFDLFHLGHMRQLEQAKKAFPDVYLICGIPNDDETHSQKGLTVLTDRQRAETVRHCRWVDEIIENAPWVVTPDFIEKHKIDYVAHDDIPYAGAGGTADIYQPIKESGKFLVTQRTEGISTSYIITKIIRDYDKYLIRNFSRGVTRQELNVSWLKKNELDFKRHIADFRDSLKQNISSTKLELNKYLTTSTGRDHTDDNGSVASAPSSIARNLGLLRKRRRIVEPSSPPNAPGTNESSPNTSPTLNATTASVTEGCDSEDDEENDDNKLLLGLPMFLNGVKTWMGNRKSNGSTNTDRDEEGSGGPSPLMSPTLSPHLEREE
ncbi:choline-phosphate cytidylyltransferase [Lipomyces kononenkoae]